MRHICGGHLDLNRHHAQSPQLQEMYQLSDDQGSGLIYQFLEKDADERALFNVHANLHRVYIGTHPDLDSYMFLKPLLTSYDRVVELSVVCFEVMYKVFSMRTPLAVTDWSMLNHPPVPVRRSMLLDSFLFILTSGQIAGLNPSRKQVSDVFEGVALYTDLVFKKLFPDRADSFKFESKNKVHAHKQKIVKISEGVWRELGKYMYYDTRIDTIRIQRGRYNIGC